MEINVKPGDTIAVWFSCGAASAVAAKKTIEKYGDICTVRVLNNPILEEDVDNQRFLRDVEKWLGVTIETVINPKWPGCSVVEVWEKRKFMAGRKGAPCTLVLKKEARYFWEKTNKADWHVLGFTLEEQDRYTNFVTGEKENTLPILIEAKITKADCFTIIQEAGLTLPATYVNGLPNSNCYGCPKSTSPTYWNLIRKVKPEIFEARAEISRRLGARLVRVKNKRIFLDELSPDAKGRSLKNLNFECGIFCEEKPKRKRKKRVEK